MSVAQCCSFGFVACAAWFGSVQHPRCRCCGATIDAHGNKFPCVPACGCPDCPEQMLWSGAAPGRAGSVSTIRFADGTMRPSSGHRSSGRQGSPQHRDGWHGQSMIQVRFEEVQFLVNRRCARPVPGPLPPAQDRPNPARSCRTGLTIGRPQGSRLQRVNLGETPRDKQGETEKGGGPIRHPSIPCVASGLPCETSPCRLPFRCRYRCARPLCSPSVLVPVFPCRGSRSTWPLFGRSLCLSPPRGRGE